MGLWATLRIMARMVYLTYSTLAKIIPTATLDPGYPSQPGVKGGMARMVVWDGYGKPQPDIPLVWAKKRAKLSI